MKTDDLADLPEYSSKDLSSSIRHESDEQEKYFDETKYETVGKLNNMEWVVPKEKGVKKMIEQTLDYGKLNISNDFIKLLKKLAKDSNSDETHIIKKGLAFLGLAEKIKKQGLKIAVVDENDEVVMDIEGY